MTTALRVEAWNAEVHPASFRDPAGFVFRRGDTLYRQVNVGFERNYALFMRSGLYDELSDAGQLVRHEEVDIGLAASRDAFAVLAPERVPFISYPYEWSFAQLQEAALLTLDVQQRALLRGMTLRDATAFNIQFIGSRAVFIDTLSFGEHIDGEAWAGYKQFCEHFLAPLLLMARCDERLLLLARDFADGVPLDLASKLLDWMSFLSPGILLHVHLHARSQRRYAGTLSAPIKARPIKRSALIALVTHLRNLISSLERPSQRTTWQDYENSHNYAPEALDEKAALVRHHLSRIAPGSVCDLGANAGMFSRIAADGGARVLCLDSDSGAIDLAYRRLRATSDERILPLVNDLTSPSPASGWAGTERASLAERARVDCMLMLALIHHLVLTAHVPLPRIAQYCASMAPAIIVEFVPFEDVQAQRLLRSRLEATPTYDRAQFEQAFRAHFRMVSRDPVGDSGRSLYLFQR